MALINLCLFYRCCYEDAGGGRLGDAMRGEPDCLQARSTRLVQLFLICIIIFDLNIFQMLVYRHTYAFVYLFTYTFLNIS